jgi:hypothetical protein
LVRDLIDDPQPKTRTFLTAEWLEQMFELFRTQGFAVVRNIDHQMLGFGPNATGHVATLRRSLHGIEQQIDQHLA